MWLLHTFEIPYVSTKNLYFRDHNERHGYAYFRYVRSSHLSKKYFLMGQRYYSTTDGSCIKNTNKDNNSSETFSLHTIDLTNDKLDPWFITGFTDAEGSFMLTISKTAETRIGYRIRPIYQIELSERDLELLKKIQAFFGGIGFITKATKGCLAFRVRSLEELKIIIAHFDSYPLKTKKRADFELFKLAVSKLINKEHLKLKGFKEVLSIRASMNLGLSDSLKEAFPGIVPVVRPEVINDKVFQPQWLSGFISGEGCFFVNLSKSDTNLIGYKVSLLFTLTQHSRDLELLESIKEYLGCGAVKQSSSRAICILKVIKFSDNFEKIIPFINKHKIFGVKLSDFIDWCEVAELINSKKHLTPEGLEKIKLIKARMNKGRQLLPEEVE